MKLLSTDNYIDFKCLGGACPISCCGGDWKIIVDDESLNYYMSVEGELGDKIRNGITSVDGLNVFKLDDRTKDCIFLDEDKLCVIQKNLGEDALCYTCKAYPRSTYVVGDIMFCFLTNSCPEVNRMIMQREEPINTLFDDSNGDGDEEQQTSDTDRIRLYNAIKACNTGMHIIQNRNVHLRDRLFFLIFYVERFQKLVIDGKDPSVLDGIDSNPGMIKLLINRTANIHDYADRLRIFMIVYKNLMVDSYKHPMWTRCSELADMISNRIIDDIEQLKKAFQNTDNNCIQRELEQLMCYRFFSVFMQGYDNLDFYDKVVYEIILLVTLKTYSALIETAWKRECLQEERILFYSLCGRIDHTKKQKAKLVRELKTEGYYEMDKLVRLLS